MRLILIIGYKRNVPSVNVNPENAGARGAQSQRDLLAHVSRTEPRYRRDKSHGRRVPETRGEGRLRARETMEERQQGPALLSGPVRLRRFLQPGHAGNVEIS